MPPHTDQARWFSEEVQPHESELRGYLRGSFPAVRDTDDVVQESLLRVWRACIDRPIHSTKSFLFQIARRIALDAVRRQRASPLSPGSEVALALVADSAPGVVERVTRREDIARLIDAFAAMPERRREVMILRKIEGVPQREIAARLGITEAAVQIHVQRGLRDLRSFFRPEDAR